VEIGTEAEQFPEKEYINGTFFAVYITIHASRSWKEMVEGIGMTLLRGPRMTRSEKAS
jgi:hypothetical protein